MISSNEPSQETLDNFSFTGWASITDGANWNRLGASNTVSVTTNTNKLVASVSDVGSGISYSMSTIAGKKYTITYDLDLISSSGINLKVINFSNTIAQKTDNISGRQSITFTAQGVVSNLQWYRTKIKDGAFELFAIDNVTTSVESTENTVAFTTFSPDIFSYSDYYPFGMLVPNRHKTVDNYRYGFSGKEMDNELKGEGNSYDYGARMYDPRVGRWFSRDPKEGIYPYLSPYSYVENNPLAFIDPDGKDAIITIKGNNITVKAVIYIDNSGKNKINIARAQRDIMKVWGGKHKDSSGKYNVKFDIVVMEKPKSINPISSGNILGNMPDIAPFGVQKGSENIVVPQEKDYRSDVTNWKFGKWADDNSFGHEVGHILGLADRYFDTIDVYVAPGSMGGVHVDTRTPQEIALYEKNAPRTSEKVDGDKSTDLMGNSSGQVSQLSIDKIVEFALKTQKNGQAIINAKTLREADFAKGLAAPTSEEQLKASMNATSKGKQRVATDVIIN